MSDEVLVLLVEDNEMNRDMLLRRLKRAGLATVHAADGEEALRQMRSHQPSVVLMDMNLPVMDGWSACRTAREDPAIRHIPIIALTAHAMDSDRREAMNAGCDEYATKPIDFPDLLAKIQRITGPDR